jgi:protein disulfide-isomerase A6
VKGTAKIAYWDTQQKGRPPALLGEIKGTPTIRLFTPKKKPKPGSNAQKVVFDYQFERKAVDLKRFLDAKMPSFVERIKEPKDLEKFNEKAIRNQLPRALLFSSKPDTSPLTKFLSTHFRRRLLLAEIKPNKKNEEILKKYGITDLPALIVIPPTVEGEEEPTPIVHEGGNFKKNGLMGFLNKHALKDPVLAVKKKEDGGADEKDKGEGKESEETKDSQSSGEETKQKVHTEL